MESPPQIEVSNAAGDVDVEGVAYDAHYIRSDDSPRTGVEPPRQIEVPDDATGILGVEGAAFDVHHARSDGSLREGVEPPRRIGVPDAASIVDVRGAAVDVHHARSDGSPRAGLEPPPQIEAPDAPAGLVDARQSPDARADVGLAADPLVGEDSVIVEPRAGVDHPCKIEVSDAAAAIADVPQSPDARADVGLVAEPGIGEAARGSPPDVKHLPVEAVTATKEMVVIRVEYKPGDEVGGASPVDPHPVASASIQFIFTPACIPSAVAQQCLMCHDVFTILTFFTPR